MINSFSFGRWPSPRINLVYPLSPPFSSRDISKIFEFSSHVFPHTYFRNGRNRKKGKFLLNARFLIESTGLPRLTPCCSKSRRRRHRRRVLDHACISSRVDTCTHLNVEKETAEGSEKRRGGRRKREDAI